MNEILKEFFEKFPLYREHNGMSDAEFFEHYLWLRGHKLTELEPLDDNHVDG